MKKRRKRRAPELTPSKDVCEHGKLTMTLGSVSFQGSLTQLVRQYDTYKKRKKRS